MKYLIILLVVVLLAFLAYNYVAKKIKGFFQVFTPGQDTSFDKNEKRAKDNVVYQKDDIVVLKGEAGKHDKKDKDKN